MSNWCKNVLEPPPTPVKDWGFAWIRWLHEVYSHLISGACHANIYQYELSTVITVSASNTYYKITGMTAGLMEGFTLASDVLTVSRAAAGRYLVSIHASYSDSGNTNFEIALFHNSATYEPCASNAATTGSLHNSASATAIIDLEEDDTVYLAISNHDNTNNATIEHAGITLTKIGRS